MKGSNTPVSRGWSGLFDRFFYHTGITHEFFRALRAETVRESGV
jgi:hypothetical protein